MPIDESDMQELLDVLQDDGSEYIIATADAPTSGLADEIARMTPEEANQIASQYADFSGQQQEAFAVAMGIPDFGSNNYPLEKIVQWIEDGSMFIITEDEMPFYIEEWLDRFFTLK